VNQALVRLFVGMIAVVAFYVIIIHALTA